MAWIHENKEEFLNVISVASERYGVSPSTIEKDYYVTLILKGLVNRLEFIVFKGGTSLSKCHRVIKRFSEDIDISIDSKLTEGQKKRLKSTIKEVSEELGLHFLYPEETRSRRNYNRYNLGFDSVVSNADDTLKAVVLLETSFAEISFPTEFLSVHSYIGDLIGEEEPDRLKEFSLEPFEMKVQGIDRTLIDKVFAICDYYMQKKESTHSRHIYDIYKLRQLVPETEDLKRLVREVRAERSKSDKCPSAQSEVNNPQMLQRIVEENVYKDDYESITIRLLEESVPYEVAIEAISEIAESDMFRQDDFE